MESYTQTLELCLLWEKEGQENGMKVGHRGDFNRTGNVLFHEQSGKSMRVHVIIIKFLIHF